VEIDDHAIPSGRHHPGQPKRLSDAELACLAVAQALLGARSEHHWLRMCYGWLGYLFPYLPKQPDYHKRLKAAGPLLAAVPDHLARQCPSWYDPGATDRRDAGTLRHLPGDGPAVRAGRVGALRVQRRAFALVLGTEAVPGHHPGGDARGLVPDRAFTPEFIEEARPCRHVPGGRWFVGETYLEVDRRLPIAFEIPSSLSERDGTTQQCLISR
jgi:hypothetical protein